MTRSGLAAVEGMVEDGTASRRSPFFLWLRDNKAHVVPLVLRAGRPNWDRLGPALIAASGVRDLDGMGRRYVAKTYSRFWCSLTDAERAVFLAKAGVAGQRQRHETAALPPPITPAAPTALRGFSTVGHDTEA